MNFLDGVKNLDFSIKTYYNKVTEDFFPYEGSNSSRKLNNKNLLFYVSFISILHNNNTLEVDDANLQKLIKTGLST